MESIVLIVRNKTTLHSEPGQPRLAGREWGRLTFIRDRMEVAVMAKGQDLIKYITQRVVTYIDTLWRPGANGDWSAKAA